MLLSCDKFDILLFVLILLYLFYLLVCIKPAWCFYLCSTPPVNSTLPAGGRTLCGAPPRCVAWPRPLLQGACRPTWSSPIVPHTYPTASTAHQVSTYITMTVRVFFTLYSSDALESYFLLVVLIRAGGKGTPASSTPATSSPPLLLSDDFPIISLPANTVQSSPPRKVCSHNSISNGQ